MPVVVVLSELPDVLEVPDVSELPEVPEVVLSDMPDEPDADDVEPCCSAGGVVVMMVVVVWLNAVVAVPNKESRMANGNFFMLTPSVRVKGCLETAKGVF